MKQIIQDLKTGKTILENLPIPKAKPGHVLIKTHRSLVSLGTERMLVDFGKANYIEKARQQPEKVKQVMSKIKSDGLKPTMEAVFRKLGEPLPLGYCQAGEVIEIGEGVTEFKIGDRVISNGHHAEVVCIPKNLVAKIPKNLSYDEASFTVIGAIALQGIRLINPTFGETVVVTGLGLIGLITAQLLKANGCQVIGLDVDEKKLALAEKWGIKTLNVTQNDPLQSVASITNGIGADGVLITASSKSNEIISQAAQMSRKRGKIVLVGVIGLDINRSDFYEKELSFQVSCSYGPGRYDPHYEQKGHDYPLAFVRWTEKRNFEAILQALSSKQLLVNDLITEKVALENYHEVYDNMSNPNAIASILEYDGSVDLKTSNIKLNEDTFEKSNDIIGVIGAGNFTSSTILPILKKLNSKIKYIASSKGLSGTTLAKKYAIANSTSNIDDILSDEEVNAVIITTRHDQHATQCIEALKNDKHVFVEKPLAITEKELTLILDQYKKSNKSITVGFNRRFSPFSIDAKKQLGKNSGPINVIATMNAGFIPADHWTQDLHIGGGRIIGEACHMIDLISYFTGSKIKKVMMNAMGVSPDKLTDNATIILHYEDGSQGTVHYFSNGNKSYSKERVEIYSQGKTMVIDNFRKSKYYGCASRGMSKSQDKGHQNQFEKYISFLKNGGQPIIEFDSILNTTQACFASLKSLEKGHWINL